MFYLVTVKNWAHTSCASVTSSSTAIHQCVFVDTFYVIINFIEIIIIFIIIIIQMIFSPIMFQLLSHLIYHHYCMYKWTSWCTFDLDIYIFLWCITVRPWLAMKHLLKLNTLVGNSCIWRQTDLSKCPRTTVEALQSANESGTYPHSNVAAHFCNFAWNNVKH